MNIFKIENDVFRFQELDLEIGDFVSRFPDSMSTAEVYDFSKNNIAISEYWELVKTGFSTIDGNENLIPDITNWIDASLVLSPRAYRCLKDLLSPFGEFLPVLVDGDTFYIFNCLTIAKATNVVDEDTFKFDDADTKEKIIFKPPSQFTTNVFCSDQLKQAIEYFELQGVIFENTKNN